MSTILYTPGTDPNTELRSDLWHTMSLEQLNHQRELAVQKLSVLSTIIGPTAPPSYFMMYNAIQQALEHLNVIVDNRIQDKQPKY